MNDELYSAECELVLDYLSGTGTKEDKEAFERHLPHCNRCKQELAELQMVWEALPTDMERVEPPKDLKKQIMTAVKSEARSQNSQQYPKRIRWGKAVLGAAAAILIFAAGSFWDNPFRSRDAALPSLEQALSIPASQIVRIDRLIAEPGEKANAYGVACIIDNGTSRQFAVYVFGAQATSGQQAYQVWLASDGSRISAGTFRVNDSGVGLLAMPIASSDLSYDRIGITLEPDDTGDHPRGPKAFGTKA
ncbi:anti-sigma factor [Paenibacillus beijingensis]|uniref:Regulator of SigK n=1 Tax=Paenibacillus beijingensis TaxID=1126833 RepID=A0A0D5NP05_9BACL|nr:anti-sigma factor [Paenibacillus beijingensis]AJY77006.1 hypothetical protein VN24_23685 [Paenibacillus beijingensis]